MSDMLSSISLQTLNRRFCTVAWPHRFYQPCRDKDNLFNVRNTGSGYPISRARAR